MQFSRCVLNRKAVESLECEEWSVELSLPLFRFPLLPLEVSPGFRPANPQNDTDLRDPVSILIGLTASAFAFACHVHLVHVRSSRFVSSFLQLHTPLSKLHTLPSARPKDLSFLLQSALFSLERR